MDWTRDGTPDVLRALERPGSWRVYSTDDGLAGLQIEHLAEDADGYLWCATCTGGLSQFDGDTFRTFTRRDGLCGNEVYALHLDRTGRLWVGSYDGGVCWWDGVAFQQVDDAIGINALHEDRAGRIWCAGAEVFGCWDDGRMTTLEPAYVSAEHRGCWGVAEDAAGAMWFGVTDLLRYDGSNFQCFEPEGAPANSIYPYAVGQGADGAVWIAREHRVWRWEGDGFAAVSLDCRAVIRKIQLDRAGRIWFCTHQGAICLEGERSYAFGIEDGLPHPVVNGMHQDREGHLWFATWGGGIACFDPHSIHAYGTEAGLPHDEVGRVETGSRDGLWVGFSGLLPASSQAGGIRPVHRRAFRGHAGGYPPRPGQLSGAVLGRGRRSVDRRGISVLLRWEEVSAGGCGGRLYRL